VKLRELSDGEFHQTFESPMEEVPDRRLPDELMDKYCESWMESEAARRGVTGLVIEHLYLNAASSFEQVLLRTNHRDVYLVIVFDLELSIIRGHHLLDLNKKYGLSIPLNQEEVP
jgi:hypothetical protein